METLRRRVAVVGRCDPGTARFEFADRLAVPGKNGVAVAYAQLNSGNDSSCLCGPFDFLMGSAAARGLRDSDHGAGFGEAPSLDHPHAMAVQKAFGQAAR